MPEIAKRPTPIQRLTELAKATENRLTECAFEVRLELLALLLGGPDSVSGLAAATGLAVPGISSHLLALRREGLVVCRHQKNLRIQMLSRAVRVEQREHFVRLNIDVPGGFPLMLDIPLDLVEELHPGYTQEHRTSTQVVRVRATNLAPPRLG